MSPNNNDDVESIFAAALDKPASARGEFLRKRCNGDDRLMQEVQSLLDANVLMGDFLDNTHQFGKETERAEHDRCLPWKLGRFELIEEIARGGMGVVYRANQTAPDRQVAVKMILPEHTTTEEAVRRFQVEAEAVAKLDHPGIVPVHEVCNIEGRHLFSMKLIAGNDLGHIAEKYTVDRNDRRAAMKQQRKIARLVLQVSNALSYAHQRGVLHRDVKPSNILVDNNDVAYLTDFGLAKMTDDRNTQFTKTSAILGSPNYMSPEHASGNGEFSSASDTYGLGAVLYQLLTGVRPFDGGTVVDVVRKVVDEDPVQPRRLNPLIHADLETIAMKCLEKDPKRRFRSADELSDELAAFIQGRPIRSRPVSWREQFQRFCQRNPVISGLAAALIFVSVVGVAGIVWKWRDAEASRVVADEQKDAARWQAYRANMATAATALDLFQAVTTRTALENAPTEYRDWEWKYCNGQQYLPSQILIPDIAFPKTVSLSFGPENQILHIMQQPTSWDDLEAFATNLWDSTKERKPHHYAGLVSQDQSVSATMLGNGQIEISNLLSSQKSNLPKREKVIVGLADNGMKVATMRSETISVWNTNDGSFMYSIPNSFTGQRWNPFNRTSDRLLAVNVFDRWKLTLYDGHSGEKIRELDYNEDATVDQKSPQQFHVPNRVAFSSDGKLIATGGLFPDNRVILWDGRTGQRIAHLGDHENSVLKLRFSNDGKHLASCSFDRDTIIWDVEEHRRQTTLRGHSGWVYDVDFSPDGQQVATCSDDRTVRIWDVETSQTVAVFSGHGTAVVAIAFDATGGNLASVDEQGVIRKWDVARIARDVLRGHTNFIYDLCVHPDGRSFATAAWDKSVRIWDIETRSLRRTIEVPDQEVRGLAYSRGGRFLAAATRDGVYWWDLETDSAAHYAKHESQSFAVRPSFHAKGQLAVPSGKKITIFDARTGERIHSFAGSTDHHLVAAQFTPDGTLLVSDDNNEIRFWDAETYELKFTLTGHSEMIRALEFNQSGSLLATSSEDYSIRLWDIGARKQIAAISVPSIVYGFAFHPNGNRLAYGSDDGTVRLLDLQRQEEVVVLRHHESFVMGLEFSPSGDKLISSSGDFTIRIWDAEPNKRD